MNNNEEQPVHPKPIETDLFTTFTKRTLEILSVITGIAVFPMFLIAIMTAQSQYYGFGMFAFIANIIIRGVRGSYEPPLKEE